MRYVKLKLLVLGLALCGGGAALDACGPYGGYFVEQNSIKFPGVAHVGAVRGNHLLCQNDKDRIIVVDLKRRKTIDLGPTDSKRFLDGDVADGKALFLRNDRLQVVCLDACRTMQEVDVGKEPVWAFGFAGMDKAFIHRGKTFSIFCLRTGKALHTIALGDDNLRPCVAWQKVGNRVFVGGPATTICVIDVEAGKIVDRLPMEARTGIANFLVEGSQIYCLGSYFNAWAPRIDHVVCFDMAKRKSCLVDLRANCAETRNLRAVRSAPPTCSAAVASTASP